MKELADILKNTSIIDLINAKPLKRKNFICLQEQDTIRVALKTFITNQIESIPIKKTDPSDIGYENEFFGIISLVNLLKFIFSKKQDLSVPALLDLKLNHIAESTDLVKRIEFIDQELSLLHLLLNVWGGCCKPKCKEIDCRHLVARIANGNYDVITPLDFLRHLLFINTQVMACLTSSCASEIENGFDVDENVMVTWGEDVRIAIDRTIRSEPFYLLAVVNEELGTLEANITLSDFLPIDLSILEESISLICRDGISLHAYIQTLHASVRYSRKSSIEPILLHPHFTIYDLIEKLTRLKIHHLWRVTPDAIQKPIGAVGVIDILRYLNFMFRPFQQDEP